MGDGDYMGDVIKHDKKFFSPKTKKLNCDTDITEDVTTADMATFDTRVGTMSKNKQKPAYGYSYLGEGYDLPSEEINYRNAEEFAELRQDIVTDFELIRDSGVDIDTAIGQIAVRYKQDPEYVKALVESQTKKINKEVMTEKEIKARKLLESYGIITKSKAPMAEEDDEESDKDEDGEKDDKKSKGPKKGVNPFAKKKDKEEDSEESSDEESSEEETEEETHEFSGAGSSVDVKGMDRETTKGIAVKLLAPLEGTQSAPKGKYTITFEPEEEELDEYAELQPSHIPGSVDDTTKQAKA